MINGRQSTDEQLTIYTRKLHPLPRIFQSQPGGPGPSPTGSSPPALFQVFANSSKSREPFPLVSASFIILLICVSAAGKPRSRMIVVSSSFVIRPSLSGHRRFVINRLHHMFRSKTQQTSLRRLPLSTCSKIHFNSITS